MPVGENSWREKEEQQESKIELSGVSEPHVSLMQHIMQCVCVCGCAWRDRGRVTVGFN